ncbi:MAG: hypothetical protein SFU27_12435 [Thermonemataceae bacterium]|nr:hypothetical protein [Thermonemataceae bacterium]
MTTQQFLVKAKGYKQLYADLERARKDYEKLKNKLLKDKAPFKIEIFAVAENGDMRLIESVAITESSPLLED